MGAINEKLEGGETVSAVLTNVKTGEVKIVGEAPKSAPKYRVEVTVINLETGEVHKYEATR